MDFHMLLKPVNEKFERMLREDGATLELTDIRLISYFCSADGIVERRIAPRRDVENEPIENENVLAAVGAPIPTARILVEPKREVAEQLLPIQFRLKALSSKTKNLPGKLRLQAK
ncbi:unnamed protein product [Caenorhabditis brenneri]